jgi:hypothetical protein
MTQYNSKTNDKNKPITDNPAVQEKVDQAQQKASEVAGEAKKQAAALTDQAKMEAKSSLQSQKQVAAQELHGVAQALRQTGSNLREQDQTMFAQYSNQFAERVERASTYLEEHDVEDLVYEAKDFARRQPELFIGGAFTLGLVAARFLKSTAPSHENIRSRSFTDSPGYREPEAWETDDMTYTPTTQYPYGYDRSPLSSDDPRNTRIRL